MARLDLVDLDTGQLMGANIRPWRNGIKGKWVRKFQEKAKELALNKELHGQTFRVMAYLEAVVKWNNTVPGSAEAAVELGLWQPNVARSYAELVSVGVLIKRANVYYLNPTYCWKGDEEGFHVTCKDLLPPA